MKTGARQSRVRTVAAVGVVLIVVVGLLALVVLTPRGRRLLGVGLAVLKSPSVSSNGDFTNIIFLHHSVGQNLVDQGGVRARFAELGYDFWDHGYNFQGVTRPDGTPAGFNYNVPDDNTDPDGLARIFGQPVYGLPIDTFSGLLQHDVVVFKSCFSASNIASREQLEAYKAYYSSIRDVVDQHPDRIFIALTPPPLNPAETDPEAAARARAFADWLTSDEYLEGHPNLFAFDLFSLLAEDDPSAPDYNMLREAYRDGVDSHPNRLANETIAPLFVSLVVDAIQTYQAWLQSPSGTGQGRGPLVAAGAWAPGEET